jgi:hypothetical protein
MLWQRPQNEGLSEYLKIPANRTTKRKRRRGLKLLLFPLENQSRILRGRSDKDFMPRCSRSYVEDVTGILIWHFIQDSGPPLIASS